MFLFILYIIITVILTYILLYLINIGVKLLKILVCIKQVIDPEIPASAFRINVDSKKVEETVGILPVINGFCENAVEAALRIKDVSEANVTILSIGNKFVTEVVKKPLSMGADQLILIEGSEFEDLDPIATVYVLKSAIEKIGNFDLILCGRQASDWDNALVPLGLSEMLNLPCITIAQKIEVIDQGLIVQKTLSNGYEIIESSLPALVTVTNELGDPRYPNLKGIMAASRKIPTIWNAKDLDIDLENLKPKLKLIDLKIPISDKKCEIIKGDDDEDTGRKLAIRLREAKLI